MINIIVVTIRLLLLLSGAHSSNNDFRIDDYNLGLDTIWLCIEEFRIILSYNCELCWFGEMKESKRKRTCLPNNENILDGDFSVQLCLKLFFLLCFFLSCRNVKAEIGTECNETKRNGAKLSWTKYNESELADDALSYFHYIRSRSHFCWQHRHLKNRQKKESKSSLRCRFTLLPLCRCGPTWIH